MENELPKGWIVTPPFDIADKIRGVSYNANEVSYSQGTGLIPVMRANNIDDNRLNYNDLVYVPQKAISQNQLLQKGDVVIAMSSGSKKLVGKTAQYFDNIKISFGAFCGALRPSKEIDAKYFGYYFQSKEYRNTISELAAGTNINNLKNEHFEALQIPLPPLAEQHRIVAKLDAVMQKVEANKQRLDKIPKLLKRFRQSVLAAAVSGKLTEEWRGRNGVVEEWKIVTLGNLIVEGPQNGMYKPQSAYGNGTMILRIDNFYDGRINEWETLKRLRVDKKELKVYSLRNDDIIINRVNSMPYLGKSALVKGLSESCVFESNMMRIKLNEKIVSPKYLIRYLNSMPGLTELRKNAKHAVNQSSINQQDIKSVNVPLPSLEEQLRIVTAIDELFAFADKLESRYTKAKAMLDKLPQSILAKAFRGELVAQDPEDEPASVLLERIRLEKAAATEKRSGKSRKLSKRTIKFESQV